MARGQCQNCKCEVPSNQWCCDTCFPLFDGEKFMDPEDVAYWPVGEPEKARCFVCKKLLGECEC